MLKIKMISILLAVFVSSVYAQPSQAAAKYTHTFDFEPIDEADLNSMQSVLWWGLSLWETAMTGAMPTADDFSIDATGTTITCGKENGLISCQFTWQDESPIASKDVLEFSQFLIENREDAFSPQGVLIQIFYVYVQTVNPQLPYVEVLSTNDLNVFTYNTTTADVTFSSWTDGSVAVKIEKKP